MIIDLQILSGTAPKKVQKHEKKQKGQKSKDIKVEKESYIDLLGKLVAAKDKGKPIILKSDHILVTNLQNS